MLNFYLEKLPRVRRFCTFVDHMRINPSSNSRSAGPRSIPIPHRTIPEPRGQDHDFITIAHSYLIHSEWPKLNSLAPKFTPFRINHILLKIQKDPVLSLDFYNFAVSQNPNSQTLETHAIILHNLTKSKRFKSAESILRKTLIPQTQNSSSDLFYAILYSYRLCDSSPNVFDSLFKAYAHMKKFRNASETFCRMRDYGFLPTIRSCNAYMSSLLDLGRTDIILAFYREMGRCRISPNVYTLNMVMYAYCNSGKLENALEVFEKMEIMGFSPTDSSYNTLISAHCKNGLLDAALKLKAEMCNKGLIPNVITYNSLIHGFCKEGKLNEANKIFNEMKTMEVKPNTVTYNTLISGFGKMNNSEMGLRIYEDMLKNGVEIDILTYNALILGLCNEGKTRKAAFLVKELDKRNLTPNSSTFAALISGQCKRENSERAFQIFKAMKRSGWHPNYDTFKILISTFCNNKDYEGALEVLREMLEKWMAPDKALLTELFEGLGRSGKSHLLTELISAVNAVRLIPEDFLDRGIDSSV
nr:pentatricopeptide repeat protein AaPPR1027 [Agave angustifolia]UPT48926.1 pentatricopeptide repeat protein AaPPR1097 [Agave angustifolia]UPT49469.1 pentatricopeptide repeat protein AaPPR541 [Agave angustifolia]